MLLRALQIKSVLSSAPMPAAGLLLLTRSMSVAQSNPPKYQHYLTGTDFSIEDSTGKPHREFQARKAIESEKTIFMSAPYCCAVTFGCAEKYCAHCHVALSHRSNQSLFNYDFYEFASCRDYFDSWKTDLYKELRADLRSRYQSGERKFRVDHHEIDLSPEHFGFIKALVMVIAKKTAEEARKPMPNPMLIRSEKDCVPGMESGAPLFSPTFADFSDLPTGADSIPSDTKKLFLQLSESIADILHQRPTYKAVTFDASSLYDTLCRMYTNSKRIIRKEGSYGAAVDTGFGVFPSSRFIRHSSQPNCDFYYDINSRLVVRSVRQINPGEAITVGDFPQMLEEVDHGLTKSVLKCGYVERQNGSRAEDSSEKLIVAKRVAGEM